MSSRYTTFKTHGKAPRSSRAWSGPWSTSVLHEFERFTKQQYYGGAATAPKHIYNTQVISYGSLFTVFVIMLISSIITFFEDILTLLFSVCRSCSDASDYPKGIPGRGKRRGDRLPSSKTGLRGQWMRFRHPRHTRQSNWFRSAENNDNFRHPLHCSWSSRVCSSSSHICSSSSRIYSSSSRIILSSADIGSSPRKIQDK